MQKRRFASTLLAALLTSFLSFGSQALANGVIEVRVNDIVAGSTAVFETSVLPAVGIDSGIFFATDPNGSVYRVYAQENSAYGTMRGELYGQQTRLAGLYKVSFLGSGGISSSIATFQVYPASVDLNQSKVTSLNNLMQAGQVGAIEVKAVDENSNAVPNQSIQLLSSQAGDSIRPILRDENAKNKIGKVGEMALTDAEGRAYFEITPSAAGVSTYTALLPQTGQVLNERTDVVVSAAPTPVGIGGNTTINGLLGANLLDAGDQEQFTAGPVERFEIDIPANVSAGTDVTMTLTAVDANGLTAAYTGKVLIGVIDDPNATFPKEYQFTDADAGSHIFNLGFRFNTPGSVKIQAFDSQNFNLGGEVTVNVSSGDGNGPTAPSPSSSAPQIKTPTDGSVISNRKLDVSGTMAAFSNGSLSINSIQVDTFSSDGDGFFTVSTPELSEGTNQITVAVQNLDGTSVSSAPVSITVDTQPPALQSLILTPEVEGNIYKPGQAITAVLVSGPLDSGKIAVQGIDYPLAPAADPGSYSTTFAAPVEPGEYSMQITLVDELFNESQYTSPITFRVQEEVVSIPPEKVKGFKGSGEDKSIDLTWNPVADAVGYTVSYGFSFDRLTESLDVPAGETSFTLSNLVNDETYYVNVAAKNAQGELGDASVILAIKPRAPEPEEIPMPQIMEPEVVDVLTGETPVDPIPTPVTTVVQPSLNAVAGQDSVVLQWNLGTTYQNLNPAGYNIYFGFQGQYTDSYFIQGNINSAVVPDLIAGVAYTFAVVPVDAFGREIGMILPEAVGVPGSGAGALGANLLPAASDQAPSFMNNDLLASAEQNPNSGPEAIWVVVFSLLICPLFYWYRRRVAH